MTSSGGVEGGVLANPERGIKHETCQKPVLRFGEILGSVSSPGDELLNDDQHLASLDVSQTQSLYTGRGLEIFLSQRLYIGRELGIFPNVGTYFQGKALNSRGASVYWPQSAWVYWLKSAGT